MVVLPPGGRGPEPPAGSVPATVYEGFEHHDVMTDRGTVHTVTAGQGPPLLLLHGFPETHLMWHATAPLLADRFSVVACDLPGYGDSEYPEPAEDHAPHSKRTLARDLIQVMTSLGHERFGLAGHDRGGRVGYRMALDHPDRVTALAVLDIVPTADVWARMSALSAVIYWHWAFLAQPAPLPERLITGDTDAFWETHVRSMGLGNDPARYPGEVMAAYRRQLDDASAVQAMCEDYRAGATIDRELDEADRGRQIACPVLCLWGRRGALEPFYGDVLAVWRPWAPGVTGRAVDASHFLVEDRPDEVAGQLAGFFQASSP